MDTNNPATPSMTPLTPNEILELFRELEDEYPLGEITYRGHQVWPLLRSHLGYYLLEGKDRSEPVNPPEKITIFQVLRSLLLLPFKLIKLIQAGFISRNQRLKLKKTAASHLIFAYPGDLYVDFIQGKKYSRYLDPYYEAISKYKDCSLFGLHSPELSKSALLHPVTLLDFQAYQIFNGLRKDILNLRKPTGDIGPLMTKIDHLLDFIRGKGYTVQMGAEIIRKIENYISAIEFFSFMIPKNKVKVAFVECYHDPVKLAFVAACRDIGISCVDIQHGTIEDFMYVPWTSQSQDYKSVPNYLWCWSLNDCDVIRRFNGDAHLLKPLPGGNMWMKKYMNQEIPQSPELTGLLKKLEHSKRRILVCHQAGFGLSKLLLEAIRSANQDWVWMIRFHPHTGKDELERMLDELNTLRNVETDFSGKVHLYELFRLSDMQVTYSSATATEALSFGLRTVLIHEHGRAYFQNEINQGFMFYADSSALLVQLLESGKRLGDGSPMTKLQIISNEKQVLNLLETVNTQLRAPHFGGIN